MKIKCLNRDGKVEYLPFSVTKFPGGELHPHINSLIKSAYVKITIEALVKNSDDLVVILLLKDIIDRYKHHSCSVCLEMPYIPYARQDRVSVYGTSLSCKVFATVLNSAKFDKVYVNDPHSDVSTALIDNVVTIGQGASLSKVEGLYSKLKQLAKDGKLVLIAPDSGAVKKTLEMAQYLMCERTAFCIKERNPVDGKLSGFDVSDVIKKSSDVEGDYFLIIDDICDGGGTFVGIANEVKKVLPHANLNLHVTHGIFSKDAKSRLGSVFNDVTSSFDWTI